MKVCQFDNNYVIALSVIEAWNFYTKKNCFIPGRSKFSNLKKIDINSKIWYRINEINLFNLLKKYKNKVFYIKNNKILLSFKEYIQIRNITKPYLLEFKKRKPGGKCQMQEK